MRIKKNNDMTMTIHTRMIRGDENSPEGRIKTLQQQNTHERDEAMNIARRENNGMTLATQL